MINDLLAFTKIKFAELKLGAESDLAPGCRSLLARAPLPR